MTPCDMMPGVAAVGCPHCGAHPGARCRTPKGRAVPVHDGRATAAETLRVLGIAVGGFLASKSDDRVLRIEPLPEQRSSALFLGPFLTNNIAPRTGLQVQVVLPSGEVRETCVSPDLVPEMVRVFTDPETDPEGLQALGTFLSEHPEAPGQDAVGGVFWASAGDHTAGSVLFGDQRLGGEVQITGDGRHILHAIAEQYPGSWPREALRSAVLDNDFSALWPYMGAVAEAVPA